MSSNLAGVPSITYGGTGSGVDGEGRITTVTASSGQSPLVSAVTYTNSGTTQPIGSLTQVTFGSSDYDTFSYDISTGRLNQYKFFVGTTPQTVTNNLTWNANGSLGSLAVTDQLNSANTQTCNYSHDDLGRIAPPIVARSGIRVSASIPLATSQRMQRWVFPLHRRTAQARIAIPLFLAARRHTMPTASRRMIVHIPIVGTQRVIPSRLTRLA